MRQDPVIHDLARDLQAMVDAACKDAWAACAQDEAAYIWRDAAALSYLQVKSRIL